ncbi:hypothetical protein Tco_0636298 [Tanacetum coccineum]
MLHAYVLDFGKALRLLRLRRCKGASVDHLSAQLKLEIVSSLAQRSSHEMTRKGNSSKSRSYPRARGRQKSYAMLRRKPLEFQVGDKVMLKVSPWKGVIRFGKRGKLNPRYIRPFKIIAKSTDKSEITRKQSKAGKHGHENQKSTKPKPEKSSLSQIQSKKNQSLVNKSQQSPFPFIIKGQGPILQIPEVFYNENGEEETQGLLCFYQTPTVLTVEIRAPKVTIHPSSQSYLLLKSKGFLKLKGA